MLLKEFEFFVPKELIAQQPLKRRAEAKLLVYERKTEEIKHGIFLDLPRFLNPGDCVVLNNTRVIPARLFGKKATGGKVEVLLVRNVDENTWECLLKPALPKGSSVLFGSGLSAEVKNNNGPGKCTIAVHDKKKFSLLIKSKGLMPLPPYIKRKDSNPAINKNDRKYYQTVYARHDGSIAAPTAGLHFTPTLLNRIASRGIVIAEIVLHVGMGTFQRITAPDVSNHVMEKECFDIPPQTAWIINRARQNGGRIIAVGTTVVRALESSVDSAGAVKPGSGWTDIFIIPGYQFKTVDCMITNFHLPLHPPFVMASAFAGTEKLKQIYTEAIEKKYRFFSYGDAMLII